MTFVVINTVLITVHEPNTSVRLMALLQVLSIVSQDHSNTSKALEKVALL
jgi:hypothetical protein